MEVPLVEEVIQDCYSYSSMDAPSELKLLILEQVSKAFDKHILNNAPDYVDKKDLINKLNKIEIKYNE